jgi:hypothetical protein
MTEAAVRADACLDVDLPIDLADHHAMNAAPTLPNGDYPFRDEVYPLAKLAISEAPPELAEFLIEQANVCTAVRKPSSGAPAFVPARAA